MTCTNISCYLNSKLMNRLSPFLLKENREIGVPTYEKMHDMELAENEGSCISGDDGLARTLTLLASSVISPLRVSTIIFGRFVSGETILLNNTEINGKHCETEYCIVYSHLVFFKPTA